MPDRREFFTAAAGSAFMGSEVNAADPPTGGGLIPRESEPPNLETPAAALRSPVTPADQFYVRNHFPTPKVDPASWRLKVDGAVERPLELTHAELKNLPVTTRTLTMECAGNGRVFLVPKVRGVNWANGAVGTAEWAGVALAAVLDRAGVKRGAVEVILEGADVGTINDDPKTPGPIAFARSLPLAKARGPEVVLAWAMNGEALTPEHGSPLRAVVGGWYGMASVKWLTRVVVTTEPFQGYWQTMDYSQFDRAAGLPTLRPITAMQVKSVILSPQAREAMPAGKPTKVTGVAWAGEQAVARVEVSADGGATWSPARLTGEARPFVWVHWEFDWTPAAGPAKLLARATDAAGRTQPKERDAGRRTYQVNHLVPVEVVAR
jgi:DMSO/TMAO reductase YedYZ molybdopterin-dependent catalytic subunit